MTIDPADLTLEEKASLTSGSSTWTSTGLDDRIPAITLSDGPHGLRRQPSGGDHLGIGTSVPAVCFPPAAGLASSWNTALVRRVGEAIGHEAGALDVQVVLGPGLNIKRSPLGGRNFEYFSEDPHLTGRLAAAMVHGIQSMGVAATPKHFAVNNQETDRLRVSAEVSGRALREIYLSAFEHVVKDAAPWAFMSAYNRINQVHASENAWLLTELLRNEWGFDGLVMSDWGAVNDRVAAVSAGLDLEMPPSGTDERVAAAVHDGTLDETVLDEVVHRLQRLIERTAHSAQERDIDGAQRVAADAARESIVLLRNDGTLPLDSTGAQHVLVIGEFARTPRFQGGGSSHVVPTRLVSALDALHELSGHDVAFEPGFTLSGDAETDAGLADRAVEAARGAETVIAFLGLPEHSESEGFDRTSLALPASQERLLARLLDTPARVVVVLSNGGAVEMPWRERTAAVLETWLLGQEGGTAIAEVLLGVTNPSGRLAETILDRLSDGPSALTFPGQDGVVVYGEDIFVGYRGVDARGADVAYPFGHGLSYTTFAYEDLEVTVSGQNEWRVSVTIRNAGERAGAEVVQLYLGGPNGSVPRAVRELRGFTKVALEPGASTRVELTVTARDLARWNTRNARWQIDAGEYRVEVGASSRDIRLSTTVESAGDGIVDPVREDSTVGEWREHPVTRGVIERLGAHIPADAFERSPELRAMVDGMPVIKLTTFGLGLTEEHVHAAIAAANQQEVSG